MPPTPETRVVVGVQPDERSRRAVSRDFRDLLADGTRLHPAGDGRRDPEGLVERYLPRHCVRFVDAVYYLTDFLFEEGLNFFVAFVGPGREGRVPDLYPRIVYKDSSLVWRVASHLVRTEDGDWVGKGDVKWVRDGDHEHLESDEDTTNLPYEIQAALDAVSRRRRPRRDDDALALVLRSAPHDRIRPYADFSTPRRRAAAAHPVHGGRPVARFTRRGDPSSLRFARGFEPDFSDGLLEVDRSASRLYGGEVRKFRFLSSNRVVQYQFVASPTHVWLNPPQTLTTEITSYGIRAHHVVAAEEAFLPGYEYHFLDDGTDPPELHSQIPVGFVGEVSPIDSARADTSPWVERMPIVREFRRRVLRPSGR